MISQSWMRRLCAIALSCLVLFESAIAAQSDLGLRLLIIQGNGAENVVEQIPPAPLTVRVVDRNNRPVAGASVLFTAPAAGPSGDFPNGTNTITRFTDEDGITIAEQFHPNSVEGDYLILVRATYMDQSVSAAIRQTNVRPKKPLGKKLVFLALAGAAAGAAFAAKKGGGSSQSQTPGGTPTPSVPGTTPTITFGGSTVGGPR